MDGARFDSMARSLAERVDRRGVAAGLAALVAGAFGSRAAEAVCPPGSVGRRGTCLCKQTGRPPVRGACPCAAGLTDTGDGLGCLACREGECPPEQPFCTAEGCVECRAAADCTVPPESECCCCCTVDCIAGVCVAEPHCGI